MHPNLFELNYIYLPDNNKSTFELKKSIALINGNQWLINPNNEKDHFFEFDDMTKKIDINKFEASSENEKIDFSMSYFNNSNLIFNFLQTMFQLSNWIYQIKIFK